MTTRTIAPNAERGAAFLDHNMGPGWVDHVDVDTLDLSSTCNCVLGQLFHDDPAVGWHDDDYMSEYDAGLRALGVSQPSRLGFTAHLQTFERLTDSWRRLIRRRRGGS